MREHGAVGDMVLWVENVVSESNNIQTDSVLWGDRLQATMANGK